MTLVEVYKPFMAAVSMVAHGQCSLDNNRCRDWFEKLIQTLENKLSEYTYECEDATFAVYAWADEVLALSSWGRENTPESLQLRFFNTNCAGDEFYDRLKVVAHRCKNKHKPHDFEILSVFNLCFIAGFQGSFYHKDKEQLYSVRKNTAHMLADINEGIFTPDYKINPVNKETKRWYSPDGSALLWTTGILFVMTTILFYFQEQLTEIVSHWSMS